MSTTNSIPSHHSQCSQMITVENTNHHRKPTSSLLRKVQSLDGLAFKSKWKKATPTQNKNSTHHNPTIRRYRQFEKASKFSSFTVEMYVLHKDLGY